MDAIVVRQNDGLPALWAQVQDQDSDDLPVDLSGATVVATAKLRAIGTDDVLQTITAAKLWLGAGGYLEIEWPTDSFDVDVGLYEVEFSISFDGVVQTVTRCFIEGIDWDDDTRLKIRVVEEF